MSTESRLAQLLSDLGVENRVATSGHAAIARQIAAVPPSLDGQAQTEQLPRLAFLYETQAVSGYRRAVLSRTDGDIADGRNAFLNAFTCWRAIASMDDAPGQRHISRRGLLAFSEEMPDLGVPVEATLAFHVAATALGAECPAEARLELKRYSLSLELTHPWPAQVIESILVAFSLLVRKASGWQDIDRALMLIDKLRDLQKQDEDPFLESVGELSDRTIAAIELVGLYHLAQMLVLVAEYLRTGSASFAAMSTRLDRHGDRAFTVFENARNGPLLHAAHLLWVGCRELAKNSIWTHVAGLGDRVRAFAQVLAARGREKPVIELWPSQQEALRRNLLDTYRRAVLVEMPTSAGKTLLAEFAIVQTKALSPNGAIVYVVPTRALVNQITMDLREDFRDLDLRVEQAVPAMELDPTEDRLLKSRPDVLVTTPEKLDLLVRGAHSSVDQLALVIADEAHHVRDQNRGARLELLLGTLKRDRADVRFMLLSPFLPNATELVAWLGDDRALPPIAVHWRPSRKIVGAIRAKGRGANRHLVLETLPASENTDLPPGLPIPIEANTSAKNTIGDLTLHATRALLERGSVLVLCRGQGTAATRAHTLAEALPTLPPEPFRDAICRYVDSEFGGPSTLSAYLQHGVAFHHAGLSPEIRWLIERQVRRGDVRAVCGTTTLAQGMNFPISAVIVESLAKGDAQLTFQDFWNIAGRAGRALVDTVGVVAFTAPSKADSEEFTAFLRGEAEEITSRLAALVSRADEIADEFNLAAVFKVPELSPLLQFLAHAMKLSGGVDLADEVEDLLRASLIYHQAGRLHPEGVRRLVRICRDYLISIRDQRGVLGLADTTGFATPSVFKLLAIKSKSDELRRPANWRPERLFGDNPTPLVERVKAISDLPEIQLGQAAKPPFSPELVASVLRAWVSGESLRTMADRYWIGEEADPEKRLGAFSSYLFSQLLGRASWGIGALEGICATEANEEEWQQIGYVPSMIFFGVQSKEAVWLRMAGAPRLVADGLAALWRQGPGREPDSYDDVRAWITGLSDAAWKRAIPQSASVRAEDMRLLWRELACQ